MCSSPNILNNKKYFLIIGKGRTQGLEHSLTAKKLYSINFTKNNKKVCIMMKQIVIYLLMVQKLLNLQQKIRKL